MVRAKCACLSSDQQLKMRQLSGNGATHEQLAQSFQLSESTVKRILAANR
jgi:DNA-directed RNA polymerase specialized sigma24 family protein